ncbi:MAG: hypothetical protein R6U70_00275 [Bacillota bacterium]|jgi:hypothetical protein
MIGYKQPCRYCETLVDPNASVCPMCGKVNPAGPLRCPVCRNPTRRQWVNCSNCGTSLRLTCPQCGEETFLGDYCDHCGERLVVVCPNPKCGAEQPPVSDTCLKCGKPMK